MRFNMLRLFLLSFTLELRLTKVTVLRRLKRFSVTDHAISMSTNTAPVPILLHVEDEDGSAFLFRSAVREAGLSGSFFAFLTAKKL